MFLKPDYDISNVYAIDLQALKNLGISAILFDLDSTIMASKTGCYSPETLEWLEIVKKDFFVGVVSNNNKKEYIEKVIACSNFPVVFDAKKPQIDVAKRFMAEYNITPECTVFVGDRPLTDVLCGKRLNCKTILVDSISADVEKPIVRFARRLERCCIRHF